MDTHLEILYKPKSGGTASKILPVLSLVAYRTLTIGGLFFCIYETFTKLRFNADSFAWFICLLNLAWFIHMLGMFFGQWHKFVKVEDSGSRQAWLDALNTNFETWIKGSFPGLRLRLGLRTLEHEKKQVRREKELFVVYLAGSCQGILPLFSRRELLFCQTIYFGASCVVLRFIGNPSSHGNNYTAFDKFIVWGVLVLLCASSFPLGTRFGWYSEMGDAARKIRKECMSADIENGGGKQEQLEWWIKAILKDKWDPEAVAEETKEK